MKHITLLCTLLFAPLVAFGGQEEQKFAESMIQLINEAEAVHDMKSADALAEHIRESEPLIMGSLMLDQKEIERIMTEAGYTEERIRQCAYKLVEKNCYGSGLLSTTPIIMNAQAELKAKQDLSLKLKKNLSPIFIKNIKAKGWNLQGGPGFTKETAWLLPSNMDEDDILDCLPGYECYECIEFHLDDDGTPYVLRPGLVEYKTKKGIKYYEVTIWFNVSKNKEYAKSIRELTNEGE